MPLPRFFRRVPACGSLVFALVFACAFAAAFDFAAVESRAETLAASAYAPPSPSVPDYLKTLSYDQWRVLRHRPEKSDSWNVSGTLFQPRFLLPGFILDRIAVLNIVDENGVRPVEFSADLFAVADEALAARMAESPLGFGGFTLDSAQPPAGANAADGETMGFIGTSHFQFRGRNSRFGAFARPIAIDTATSAGEQVPYFREMWLFQPAEGAAEITVYALMDSPALTGAFSMTVLPGTSAILDVHAKFYARNETVPAKVGIAPVTGMFLFSETEGRPAGDYRPEVHNCDGLLVASDGDWQWTPLKNPQRLTIGSRELTNPRGFGLLQRDADFDHYQDLKNRYDRCPSVWIEPKGDWGPGRVELVEIPGGKDFHFNIVAYWVPEPAANGVRRNGAANGNGNGNGAGNGNGNGNTAAANAPANANGAGEPAAPVPGAKAPAFAVDYRIYWMPPGARLHELGAAKHTRMVRSAEDGTVVFTIDFESEALNALPADTGLTSVVEAPDEAPLVDKNLMKNDVTGGWRLTLRFKLPQAGMLQSLLTAREGPPQLRFAAHLKRGENLVEPLTETWRYSLTP